MRLIDADELVARIKKFSCDPCVECGRDYRCKYCEYRDVLDAIEDAPTLEDDEDAGTVKGYVEGFVRVVRCKDCEHYQDGRFGKYCRHAHLCIDENWYCADGQRKDDASHPFAEDVMMGERKDNEAN